MNQGPACWGVQRRAPGGDPGSWISERCFSWYSGPSRHSGTFLGNSSPGIQGKELRLAAEEAAWLKNL